MGYLKKLEEDKKLKMRYNLCEMLYVQLMTVAEIKKWTYDSYNLEVEQIKEIVLDVNNESPYIKSLFTTENIIKETRLILYKGLIEGKGVRKIFTSSPYTKKSINMILDGITLKEEFERYTDLLIEKSESAMIDKIRNILLDAQYVFNGETYISSLYKHLKSNMPLEYDKMLTKTQLMALVRRYGVYYPTGNPYREGRNNGFSVIKWIPNDCSFTDNMKETEMVRDICDLLYIEKMESHEIVKELECPIQLVNKIKNKAMYTDLSNMYINEYIENEIKNICYCLWERKYNRKGVIKVSALNRKTTMKIIKRQLFREISEPYLISSLNDLNDQLKECINDMLKKPYWANKKSLDIYNDLLSENKYLLYKKNMPHEKSNLYEKIFIMSIIDYYRETQK